MRRKLMATVADLQPRSIVFVGDMVHAPRPGPEERAAVEATFGELAANSDLVLIPGNHDRGFHRTTPAWRFALSPSGVKAECSPSMVTAS